MIRKLKEEDRQKVLQYLYQEPTYNIFIIGDIEQFGFDTDFQHIYGEMADDGRFLSVLLFYYEHAVYYADQIRFNQTYLSIFRQHKFDYMSGKESLMKLLQPHLPEFHYRKMYFCEATSFTPLLSNDAIQIKQVKTVEDIQKLYDLMVQIDEFGIKHKDKESFINSTQKALEMGVKYCIEEDGKFVSSVATTADTTINAMVIGVATIPGYRNKGYASILMTHLMDEYINKQSKSLCLFYDNPEAGKIYLRLGFKDIGTWVMMSTVE
jgi:predicted GNAT family acetyltransferase